MARISYSHDMVGDVMGDDGTGSDNCTIAYRYARKHSDIASNPYTITNNDRQGAFNVGVAAHSVKRMDGRIEATIGPDVDMMTECYACFVEYYEVVVGKEEIAYFYI